LYLSLGNIILLLRRIQGSLRSDRFLVGILELRLSFFTNRDRYFRQV
jgi:hypothetical protein